MVLKEIRPVNGMFYYTCRRNPVWMGVKLHRLIGRHDDDRRLLPRCSGPYHWTLRRGIRRGVVRRFCVVRDVDHVHSHGGWVEG